MNPIQKAVEAFDKGEYDANKVLENMAALYPQVFLQLVKAHSEKPEKTFTGPGSPVTLTPAHHSTVLMYLNQKQLVKAIKYVREVTGAGLKDAKAYVDKYREGTPSERWSASY